ncbi:MAG: UvrB/UvrC motif-containing protein [Candidatus Omnitrophica bacterium]|nr:UvrB/UvrC motif-containing protein [Candidatus Omnitrophota bacterium]MBU1895155.1 UvrB/UvrC motif-containing protein [Candidatus Omnitrophota bacterium]
MRCNICGRREATVHLTEVVNEKVTKLHLCEECAKAKSDEMQSHFGLAELLSGLVDFNPSVSDGQLKKNLTTKCPVCGMTYYDFQNTGRLGCGTCYETFSDKLSELLKKIHGADRHTGKVPYRTAKTAKTVVNEKSIKDLKDELSELVIKEEFEKAVFLRDKIKDLEEK